MLALIRDEDSQVSLRQMPAPSVQSPDDVLVRVKAAAVCSTDIAIVSGVFGGDVPRILGHEIAGEVIETGSDVGKLKAGDRVALQPTIYCGECPPCSEDNWHLCPNRKFVGLHADGGFAELMVVPEVNLVSVPKSVPFEHACFVEPLGCVIHAINRLGQMPRKGVIITGAGISAYLFAQVLIAKGVATDKILVTGKRDARLAAVKKLGINVLDVRKDDLSDTADRIFGQAGPDVMIDQTGDPELFRQAMDILSRQGTLFIYDFTGHEIPFNFGMMQIREITIKTSTGCPATMDKALAMMEAGQVDLSPVITHTYQPSQMKEAFEILKSKDQTHIKSIIEFE